MNKQNRDQQVSRPTSEAVVDRSPSVPVDGPSSLDREAQIRQAAYQRYQRRLANGSAVEGGEVEDWLAAEAELAGRPAGGTTHPASHEEPELNNERDIPT